MVTSPCKCKSPWYVLPNKNEKFTECSRFENFYRLSRKTKHLEYEFDENIFRKLARTKETLSVEGIISNPTS